MDRTSNVTRTSSAHLTRITRLESAILKELSMNRRTFLQTGIATVIGIGAATLLSNHSVLAMPSHAPVDPDHQWGWCPCYKCGLLFFGANNEEGICPVGGTHELNKKELDSSHLSGVVFLIADVSDAVGQPLWCWCSKCQGMWYAEHPASSACAAGGLHEQRGSFPYVLTQNDPRAQGVKGWKWCSKCQGLFHDQGPCAAGGIHDGSRSGQYTLQSMRADIHLPAPHINNAWYDKQTEKIRFQGLSLRAYDSYNIRYSIRLGNTFIANKIIATLRGDRKRILFAFEHRTVGAAYAASIQGCLNNGSCSQWSDVTEVQSPVPID